MTINKIYITAALLLIIVAGWLVYRQARNQNEAADSKTLQQASARSFTVEPEMSFIDHAGIPHSEFAGNQNTIAKKAVQDNPGVSLGGADTVAKALGIQRDKIAYWKQIAIVSQGENLKAHTVIDSLKRKVREYRDEHIYIAYTPGIDSGDAGTFNYDQHLKVRLLQYWKPKWPLLGKYGPQKSMIDLSTDDSHTRITGYEDFTVKPNPINFALKGQLGTAFDFGSGALIPSAGLILNMGNFEVSGRYYYSAKNGRFQPIVSAAYNFLNL